MTYEYAVYFKLLLLCGHKDDLNDFVDDALEKQDPVSDIVLKLNEAGADDKKILNTLNEYILRAEVSDINWDGSVFDLVMTFLKRKYNLDSMPMRDITKLMYKLALCTERYNNEPWYTMYIMDDLLDEAEAGYIDRPDFQRKFDDFINHKVCLCNYTSAVPKESFFKRLIKKLRRNR